MSVKHKTTERVKTQPNLSHSTIAVKTNATSKHSRLVFSTTRHQLKLNTNKILH